MKPNQPAGEKFAKLGDPLVGGHMIRMDGIGDLPDAMSMPIQPPPTRWIALRNVGGPSDFQRMGDHGWMRGTPARDNTQAKTVA